MKTTRKIVSVLLTLLLLTSVTALAAEDALLIGGTPSASYATTGNASFAQQVYDKNDYYFSARTDAPIMPEVELAQSVIDMSNEIVGSETDDFKKLRLIHNWVSSNITYDYDVAEEIDSGTHSYFLSRSQESEDVLENRLAVCDGYANLARDLALAQGIPCYYIYGVALSTSSWSAAARAEGWETVDDVAPRLTWSASYANHAWNEAYVNGRWVVFDCTWGEFDYDTSSFSEYHLIVEDNYEPALGTESLAGGTVLFNRVSGQLSGFVGEATELVIPAEFGGCSVTSIADDTFWRVESLTSVVIPSTVTSIGENAFSYNDSLTSVEIQSSETSGTSIGYRAFDSCPSLATVTLHEGVTSIGREAFSGAAITSIDLPESLTSIGYDAFSGCDFTTVTIPAGVTEIQGFHGCHSLTTVTIPEGATSVDGFYNCSSLTSITIPSTVTSIGSQAFYGCSSLETITIPEGVTEIGGTAFYHCTSLTSITIPSSVTSIGERAFAGCTALTSAEIYSGSVGTQAFNGCTALETVELHDGVTRIGDYSFAVCSSLETITIPSTVTYIGPAAFQECPALTSVTIPEGVTGIGGYTFDGCSSLVSAEIPSSVERIDSAAFRGCSSLTSITIPEGVTRIEDATFYNCSSLISAAIPEGVTHIGGYAFYGCSSLVAVEIPSSVTSIGENAFTWSSALTDVYYRGSESEWNAITISANNDILADITVHFNSTMPEIVVEPTVEPTEEPTEEPTVSVSFTDVAEGDWYHDTVIAAANANIIAGNADGTFKPLDKLSWAQAITFAVRLDQYVAGERIYGAADQTGANWYDVYVNYAIEHGIITEAAANPNSDILRGDAAVIFAAVLGEVAPVNEVADGYFTDVASDAAAHDAVYTLARAGIANGKGGGEFGVNDTFLRCEVATIVARMAGLVEPAKMAE